MIKTKSDLKVMTIVGTRPELIRLSRVITILDSNLNHILVHTGQNYDYELNEIFFEELEIPKPDHFLNVDTTSLGKILGNTLISIEPILIKEIEKYKPTIVKRLTALIIRQNWGWGEMQMFLNENDEIISTSLSLLKK